MTRPASQIASAGVAMLCVLVAASCGGGKSAAAHTTPSATTQAAELPPLAAPSSIPSAQTKAELTRLLAEAGVKPGRTADPGTTAAVWRAFKAFAGIEIDDPFLADTLEQDGDGLSFSALPGDSRPYGETYQVSFVRRNKFNDFAGNFSHQQQVRVTVHFAPTSPLTDSFQSELWSYDEDFPDLAAQFAAWEQLVDSTPVLRRALAGAKPIAVEVVREEGSIH